MTRIVAGTARGRRLEVPPAGTRPTSDRVREAVFSAIDSALRTEGRHWPSIRALDLFAGSGALGLEAVSRGVTAATLVDSSRRAGDVLRRNAAAVGGGETAVIVRDVRSLGRNPGQPFDLCFADPPYEWTSDALARVLGDLAAAGWLAGGALCVVERAERDTDPPFPPHWTTERRRTYGDTAIWYGRATLAGQSEAGSAEADD